MADNNLQSAKEVQDLLDLLQKDKSLKEFRDMFESPADLEAFAYRAKFITYDLAGYQITRQGEVGRDFFIVISGQLRAVDVSNPSNPHLLNYMTRGAIVGTRALLSPDKVRTATVETVTTQAKLAAFDENDWRWLLNKNPGFRALFEAIESNRTRQSSKKFPGRQLDEVVVIATKRHFVAFLARLPLPITLLIAPIFFFLLAEILGIGFSDAIINALALVATLPFFIVAILLIIYHYFDWRNDDLIVTTKRVVHIERILFYGEQRRDAPLVRVEDVITLSDLFDYVFDSDSIIITTAGAGKIEIDHIRHASEVRQAILEQAGHAKQRVSEADLTALHQNLASELGFQDALPKTVMAVAEPEWTDETNQTTTHHYSGVIDYFIPRVKEVERTGEDSTVITWRKHRFVLLANILKPTIFLIILFYLFLIVVWPPFQFFIGIGILGSLFWYVWEYDDWRRDLYQLTDTHIIDIDSAAFRLSRSRRDGSFDKIQNVYTEVPNFFYKLINMGDVIIETAGSEGKFTFKKVYNPTGVNKEIFNRWAQYQRRQHEQQRDATNREVTEILKEYHRITTKFANRR